MFWKEVQAKGEILEKKSTVRQAHSEDYEWKVADHPFVSTEEAGRHRAANFQRHRSNPEFQARARFQCID